MKFFKKTTFICYCWCFGFDWREVDEQRRGVVPTLPHLRQPVRPETERRTAIIQTVPTKAPVEAKTSTITN